MPSNDTMKPKPTTLASLYDNAISNSDAKTLDPPIPDTKSKISQNVNEDQTETTKTKEPRKFLARGAGTGGGRASKDGPKKIYKKAIQFNAEPESADPIISTNSKIRNSPKQEPKISQIQHKNNETPFENKKTLNEKLENFTQNNPDFMNMPKIESNTKKAKINYFSDDDDSDCIFYICFLNEKI